MNEASLQELMEEAFQLSLQCGYGSVAPNGDYYKWRENSEKLFGEKNDNLITAWADGLIHKYYENRATGRCSLNAIINFDLEKFEQGVKDDIALMKTLLAKVGPPKQLTFEDMRALGHRGKEWCNYTEDEDNQFYFELHKTHAEKYQKDLDKLPKKEHYGDNYFYIMQNLRGHKEEMEKYRKLLDKSQ